MEKGIDRMNKHIELKKPIDEKNIEEDRQFKIGGIAIKEKETRGGGDIKEGEASTPRTNAIGGFCAICHLTLGINSNLNQNISCSQGHALCQRCVQHFRIQLDPGCILCHAQYQQSNVNLSQDSDFSLNSVKLRPNRSQVSRYQSEYQSKHHHQCMQQHTSINAGQSYVKSWNQNSLSVANNVKANSLECYNDGSETSSDYERSNEQNNIQKEIKKDRGKRNQQYSQCNLFEKEDLYTSEVRVNGQITLECSRRPIRCPRIDCAINVAFSALTHHFIFDHPEVPILSVEPGIKSTLIVSFNALSSDSSRCLALLLVSGKLSDPVARLFNGNQMNPKFRNRLPLSVLAARLHCKNQCMSVDKINKTNDLREKDVIIAWVAGLDIGNTKEKLLCSIQAIDKIDTEGLRSLTYTGPVNSLRTAQCPEDIFSTGDCIVLHEGLLNHITSDCATLNVNVTVH